MAEESVMYYNNTCDTENTTYWSDNDDLQTLMHAAADADARDNEEALIKEREIQEQATSSNFSNINSDERKYKSGSDDEATNISYDNAKGSSFNGYYEVKKDENVSRSAVKCKLHVNAGGAVQRKQRRGEGGECYVSVEAHSNVVAAHYNTLEDKGLDERLKSRIFYMRNFNNWIKSMLINEYLSKVKEGMKHNSPIRVMDMCCGKGGDLLKWRKGNISYLICTDIATVSLEQCESRYMEMCARSARERNAARIYKAEFISADSTRVRLREKYADPSIKLDLVSCQFAFHYSFESLAQAECMLRNAAECLQPGGYFIGTIPDANIILTRQRKAKRNTFGNDIYQITFQCDSNLPPLFGAKYNFHLDGVVDCPEFLVHFPTFVKLAKKFGLQLVRMETFPSFYEQMNTDGLSLLQKMQCLETYPPFSGAPLLGKLVDDYTHASDFFEDNKNKYEQRLGTLSRSEWEAVSLYLTFAFKKAKTTWDSKGKPQYDFT